MNTPILPYDPEVDTFGSRILKIDSCELTYEEAYQNPIYVDKALEMNANSDDSMPVSFTQFVLRKMAVDVPSSSYFEDLLHPKAREYLLKLIGPQESTAKTVHPKNTTEHPSLFRSTFTKLFCRKVIMNLYPNVEDSMFDELAQIFPFEVSRNVPEYKISILNCFDNGFYNTIQRFLDEHFDNVDAREVTKLFLNNIRHFFDTKFSLKQQSPTSDSNQGSQYLKKCPRLTEEGIEHYRYLYKEYQKVRKHFNNRNLPYLNCDNEDFRKLPEKNIDDVSSLLQSIGFRTKRSAYVKDFKKYVFFFIHALEKDPNPVFFIDDMLYECLKSLHTYKTVREDMNIVNDIAMVSLLWIIVGVGNLISWDYYYISSTTLHYIKDYVTAFVSTESRVKFNVDRTNSLTYGVPILVANTICFDIYYVTKKMRCERGIMYFLDRVLRCALYSEVYEPIKEIVCYSAYLGDESRFAMPEDVESLRSFVRLSTKPSDVSEFSSVSVDNGFFNLLRDHLIISES